MDRNNQSFDVKMNVDLYIKVKAQAGSDAEYAAMQIIVDKLLKSDVVHRIDPRVITTTLIVGTPFLEETDDTKY